MHLRVHLVAPGHPLGVGALEVGDTELFGDHEVGLHVADQGLDDALGLRIRALAKVRSRPVVGDEADVVRRRDHEPGHRASLQAPHAVGEQSFGHTADGLHARRQRGHGRLGTEVVGEEDEAEAAPGQHGAEHEQGSDLPPVEHQHVARRPDPGPAPPVVITAPLGLGVGHRPAEVAGRAGSSRPPPRPAGVVWP